LKYFSSYYDYDNHIKHIYSRLDSNFNKTNSTSFSEETVYLHGDTLICDGYNFTPSIKTDECITIRYTSESGRSHDDLDLCLEEIKTSFKINNLVIDTCYVFSVINTILIVDSYNSKIYFDFSRKMMVKEESINGGGEVVASIELFRETPLDNLPNQGL
jgi:hypothetical protein